MFDDYLCTSRITNIKIKIRVGQKFNIERMSREEKHYNISTQLLMWIYKIWCINFNQFKHGKALALLYHSLQIFIPSIVHREMLNTGEKDEGGAHPLSCLQLFMNKGIDNYTAWLHTRVLPIRDEFFFPLTYGNECHIFIGAFLCRDRTNLSARSETASANVRTINILL